MHEKTLICPKCQSMDVSSNMTTMNIITGAFQNEHKCNDCGFEGMFFPEVDIDIKKKEKKK